jgi:hypothetical protein
VSPVYRTSWRMNSRSAPFTRHGVRREARDGGHEEAVVEAVDGGLERRWRKARCRGLL